MWAVGRSTTTFNVSVMSPTVPYTYASPSFTPRNLPVSASIATTDSSLLVHESTDDWIGMVMSPTVLVTSTA